HGGPVDAGGPRLVDREAPLPRRALRRRRVQDRRRRARVGRRAALRRRAPRRRGQQPLPRALRAGLGDLLRSAGKAPGTFSRAGFTGAQKHGIFWAGDESSTWQAFGSSVTAGITASASGIVYWGWDLGGFSGPVPEPELDVRAAAAAAFMPARPAHPE